MGFGGGVRSSGGREPFTPLERREISSSLLLLVFHLCPVSQNDKQASALLPTQNPCKWQLGALWWEGFWSPIQTEWESGDWLAMSVKCMERACRTSALCLQILHWWSCLLWVIVLHLKDLICFKTLANLKKQNEACSESENVLRGNGSFPWIGTLTKKMWQEFKTLCKLLVTSFTYSVEVSWLWSGTSLLAA